MIQRFSSQHVRRILGIPQRQLDYWDQRGIVSPSMQKAHGKGSQRYYSFTDLVKLMVVKRLRQAGLSLQKIRKGLRKIRRHPPDDDPLLTEMLVTDGKGFFLVRDGKTQDILAGGQLLLGVALGRIRKELMDQTVRMEIANDSHREKRQRASG